jgi:hypothetical protein
MLMSAAACGDEPSASDSSGAGGDGATTSASGGAGGGGGGAPECPQGSHDEGGVCTAALGAWQAAPPISDARDHHVTFTVETPAGPFLYVAGGAVDMSEAVPSIERTAVSEDGTPAGWQAEIETLAAVGPSVVVSGKQVLIAGGIRASGIISAKTSLLTVGDDGAVSVAEGPEMLYRRFHHAMVMHGPWAYAVGGAQSDATSQTSVERIHFDAQGPGQWIEDRALPKPRSHHGLAQYGDALYVVAGLNRFDGDPFPYEDESFADVLRASIAEDGSLGEWTTVGQLPDALAVHASFAHAGQLYVVGGLEGQGGGGDFVAKIQRAPIADDGTLGAFETLPTELPMARGHSHQVPMIGAHIYSVAGAASHGFEMMSQPEAFFARFE